jgi:DNA repair exonuclease SbcCD nuclease subunit
MDEVSSPTGDGPFKMEPGTVLIPGAPLHHNFGDSRSRRGCWTLDFKKHQMEFKQLRAPEFVVLDETVEGQEEFYDVLPALVRGNYVSMTVRSKEREDFCREVLTQEAKGFILKRTRISKPKNRLDLTLDMKRSSLLKQYLRKTTPKAGRKILYKVGMDLISRAEKELGG